MDELLEAIFFVIAILLFLMLVVFGIVLGINGCNYFLDKSMCNAYVADDLVYQGRCHFLSINSIGENGTTKKLIIYKDKVGLKPAKVFINDDIKITEME